MRARIASGHCGPGRGRSGSRHCDRIVSVEADCDGRPRTPGRPKARKLLTCGRWRTAVSRLVSGRSGVRVPPPARHGKPPSPCAVGAFHVVRLRELPAHDQNQTPTTVVGDGRDSIRDSAVPTGELIASAGEASTFSTNGIVADSRRSLQISRTARCRSMVAFSPPTHQIKKRWVRRRLGACGSAGTPV